MVVPLILGKMILDIDDILSMPTSSGSNQLMFLIIGFCSAFFTGLWACKLMIKLVKRARLKGFATYCIMIGTLTLIWILTI